MSVHEIAQTFVQTDEALNTQKKALKPLRVNRKTRHDALLNALRDMPESEREIQLDDGRRVVLDTKPRRAAVNEEYLVKKFKQYGMSSSESSDLASRLWNERDVVMSETIKVKK